jgi:hypothetical protein
MNNQSTPSIPKWLSYPLEFLIPKCLSKKHLGHKTPGGRTIDMGRREYWLFKVPQSLWARAPHLIDTSQPSLVSTQQHYWYKTFIFIFILYNRVIAKTLKKGRKCGFDLYWRFVFINNSFARCASKFVLKIRWNFGDLLVSTFQTLREF